MFRDKVVNDPAIDQQLLQSTQAQSACVESKLK